MSLFVVGSYAVTSKLLSLEVHHLAVMVARLLAANQG
jgi:hypothetical protein